ncbi:hypothetical protein TSUD_286040 [Trifolium subterraneum]|uniref:Uncharacterized protein n=1 Tax=Trifolium subterraneum TaxID=3900 RepID=A0A2Z6NR60_TRISU|nr:hypothetical protein TSUD_286040 [Trifolium subterraneum]
MDPSRRAPRTVIDPVPKFRQVGFFAPPDRSQSGPIADTSASLSPVMIPPPRHLSDNLILHARPANSPRRGPESITVGGSNSDAPVSPAPSSSYSSRFVVGGDRGFFDGKGKDNGKVVASSFPRGGFDLTALKGNVAGGGGAVVPASQLTTVSVVNDSLGIPGERFFRF